MSKHVQKKFGYPADHPIDLHQVAHDLAIARTTLEITPDDKSADIYYRYYYNFDEFNNFFKMLKENASGGKTIELPVLKEIKP